MGLRFNIDLAIKSAGADQAAAGVRKVSGEAQKATRSIDGINAGLKRMAAVAATAFSVREIGQFVASTVKAASDVQEMQSLLSVTFGRAVDDVREWAAETSSAVGRSRFELLKFAGDFATFLKPLGTAPDALVPMSEALAQLTVDLASFRNLSEEDVFIKLQSGLAGEAEAVRRLGVDLSAAAIEQELLNQGIAKAADEVTQAEKIMARYAIILRQTADAQGDAERTSGGLANTQRRLQGILMDVRVEIGRQLLPIITEMAQDLAEFSRTQEFEDTIKGIGEAARGAAELVRGLVDAVRLLGREGQPLADVFNKIAGADQGPDPERLRQTAEVIRTISLGQSGLADKIDAYADSVEKAATKVRESKGDFDLSGVLSDANAKIADLTAEHMERIGVETEEAAQLSKEALRELEAEAKKYQDRVEDLRQEIRRTTDPMAELRAEVDFAWEAFRAGDLAIHELTVRLHQLGGEMDELTPKFEILSRHVENLPKGVPFPTKGIEELGDDVTVLVTEMEHLEGITDEWVVGLENVADLIDLAFGNLDSDLADAAREIVQLIDSVTKLARAWDDLSTAQRAAGVAGVAGQAVDLFGLGGEGEAPGAFGGSGGGDYADTGAAVGAVIGAVIGAAIAAYFTGGLGASEGAVIGAAIGGLIGEVIGGFINRGADEGLAQLRLVAGQIETKVTKDEGGLGAAVRGIGDAVIENIDRITEILQVSVDSLPTVDIKVRGENIVAKVGEYRKVFQEIDEAIEFLVVETLRAAEFSGGIDEALTQVLQAGRFGDVEGLAEQLSLIDQLITAEKIFIQGLSEMEVQLEALPRNLALMRTELENMGLSADQVSRLAGAAAVQAFSQARQAITGEQQTVEQRRAMQKAQAELFNAQLQLEIFRLEAERDVLMGHQQISIGEIDFQRARLKTRAEFVNAEAQIYKGELGVMQGFTKAGAGIVNVGVSTVVKQIEAINKVIEGLKKLFIDIGTLKLPGLPKAPKLPSGGIPGGGGPAGPTGPSFDDQLRILLDSLFPDEARMRELAAQVKLLDRAFAEGEIGAGRYQEALERVRDQMGEAVRAEISGLIDELGSLADETAQVIRDMQQARDGLADFLVGLRIEGASPTQSLPALEAQLRAAQQAALGGDLGAVQEFQRLAQQFLQASGQAFGTGGAGFLSRLRLVEGLGEGILDDLDTRIESEIDFLDAISNQLADLLEANMGLHDLTKEEIAEIRKRADRAEQQQDDLRATVGGLRAEQRDGINRLNRNFDQLRNLLAEFLRAA